ncbi:hypothetical protein HY621_04365 [Candidatus Uhrbacteria bacterium]|nr:hypothetical protein [Candidatus Uhrbacteria bacterium]
MKKIIVIFLCGVIAAGTSLSLFAQEQESEKETLDLQFYASPLQVVKGDRVRLDWESEDAEYCEASGSWSGRRETFGSVKVVAKKKIESYKLQCFDEEGNISETIVRQVTVFANKKKLKRKKLSLPTPKIDTQSNARNEEDVAIAWSSPKGTVACQATGPDDWEGLKMPNSSGVFSAEIGKEYSLICWNQNGVTGERAVHTFEKKPNKYSARDVGLSKDFLPMYPDDVTLADGREVYFIDFIRRDERSVSTDEDDLYYWGKRIVIDPDTNLQIEDEDVLTQLHASEGQVPPDVTPSSKLIKANGPISFISGYESYKYAHDDLSRFVNDDSYLGAAGNSKSGEIPTLSPAEVYALAIDYTLEHLDLPKTQTYKDLYKPSILAIWFNGTVAGVPMFYETTVYDWKDEKIRQIVLDPYTGEDMTGKGIFDDGVWDRTILTAREPLKVAPVEKPIATPPISIKGEPVGNPPSLSPVVPPTSIQGQPVSNPPTQTGVPPTPQSTPSVSSQCPANTTYSPTFGICIENAPVQNQGATTHQSTCPTGQSYSTIFGRCVE